MPPNGVRCGDVIMHPVSNGAGGEGDSDQDHGMIVELDYRWRLREVMATRGMFSTTDLRPLLAQRGVELSQSQVYRLVAEQPERLNLRTLMALLDILDCTITDLIEPLPVRRIRHR